MERSMVGVESEIGRLRGVICHTPGPELLAVTPSTREDFLYDDIIDLELARQEHGRFKAVLERFCTVYEVRELLETIADRPEVRGFLIERVMDVARSEPLARELMERPAAELVSLFVQGRAAEVGPLQAVLQRASYDLPPLPNLFFTRDAAMVVGRRIIVGSMRYTVRWTEEILMKVLFQYHPQLANEGFLYDGSEERRAAHTIEGGDVHVLRPDLALIGISERSSPAALDTLAQHMVGQGISDLIVVVLPTARAMIHLDMVFTMVDHEHCVVYPPSFVGPTRNPVLHYRHGHAGMREMPNLFAALREVGMPLEPVFCGGDDPILQEREQWASGCNFVCVRPGLVLGYARNERTCEELQRQAGYRCVREVDFLSGAVTVADDERAVITFEGSELVRGGGGGRCMTLPVRRDPAW